MIKSERGSCATSAPDPTAVPAGNRWQPLRSLEERGGGKRPNT
jgi:hypothetical protein